MKIFIAGICGTFMAGIAQLAKASGYVVSGCDDQVYPPMSDLLQSQNIDVLPGYLPEHLGSAPDMVLMGNVLSRGNPLVEHVLNHDVPFQSGPQWLREHVLKQRKVIAVAGTHGKTTTSSILAWILQSDQKSPGYLIGGKPGNFTHSAHLGSGEFFVIEADEYDTAFFDKRSKFVHYRPRIAILNNLEFDHADIFDDLAQIMKQFHHLIRIIPSDGHVVVNADDNNLAKVVEMSCWSNIVRFSVADDTGAKPNSADAEWCAIPTSADCSSFDVIHKGQVAAKVNWSCIGKHNMQNALAALATAELAGIPASRASECLNTYLPPERRLQLLFQSATLLLYDDFAHHPTAICQTINALRAKHPDSNVIAVVELRSNTMKMGSHGEQLMEAIALANCAIISGAKSSLPNLSSTATEQPQQIIQADTTDEIISAIQAKLSGNDIVVTMSNGSFGGLPKHLAKFFTNS